MGSLSLLQGVFLTQRSNPGLPHCRRILHQLSHKVSPRILEWVAYPFSRGSSQHRNWTGVSCIAGRFLSNWALREAPYFKVKVAQLYTVHRVLQARIPESVAFPFSRGSFQPRDQIQVSHITNGFFTSWATREAGGAGQMGEADQKVQTSSYKRDKSRGCYTA